MKLILRNIKKEFNLIDVLKGCDFEFESGKIYGLLGRNGAGKTTLFNIIYSELEKDSGEILLEQEGVVDVVNPRDVGMVFAETFLPDFLTGYEFIKFFTEINGNKDNKHASQYLNELGFKESDQNKLIKNYSSGMKSKISLLTIVLGNQKIILLDEPLTAVDIIMAEEIKRILRKLKDDHVVILSTHMLDLAKDLCDEIVLLHNGVLKPFVKSDGEEMDEQIVRELLEESEDV